MRDLLKSLTQISEAETKDTKTGRIHKGDYGNKHGVEDVRDQYGARVGKKNHDVAAKKEAPKKGRGRPKKGADDSGEVKSYDSSALSNVFGGGKKPSKAVGTVSKKHSLKEYIESVADTKEAESVMEGLFGGVDHTSVAANLSKLARVIKSVQTPEQFAVAQKYAQRMRGTILNHQHDNMGFGSGMRANLGVMRDVDSDLKAKAQELGIPFTALEEGDFTAKPVQGGQQLQQVMGPDGKPAMGAPLAAPVAQKVAQALNTQPQSGSTTMEEDEVDEDFGTTAAVLGGAALGAKLGKTVGIYRDAKSSEEAGLAKPRGTWERAKGAWKGLSHPQYDDGDEVHKINPKYRFESKKEKEPEGLYSSKRHETDGQRIARLAKEKRQAEKKKSEGKVDESAKPDFLDVDKDSDKKESFKKAVKDKEAKKKVAEGRDQEASEYLDEKVAKILAREKPGMETVRSNDAFYGAVYNELIACGLTPKAARYKVSFDEDFMSDVSSAYEHYQSNPAIDEGWKGALAGTAAGDIGGAVLGGTVGGPVGATIGGALGGAAGGIAGDALGDMVDEGPKNFLQVLSKKPEQRFESKNMKDIQLENWENQLNSLLTEGISVSSSTGQQGSPDSVSVTATDGDSQALLAALRNAGIGVFGGGDQQPEVGFGINQGGEEGGEGHGTDPEASPEVVGDGDDMIALIKKMTGIEQPPTQGFGDQDSEEDGQDYEDEEGSDETALQPADGEEGSDEEGSEEKEETDEGNAFTGKLKQTPQGDEFKLGDKSYKDTSEIEEGGFDREKFGSDGAGSMGAGGGDIAKEGEEKCSECGGSMTEGHECGHEQVEEAYANSDDDQKLQDMKYLLQSLSGGLNGPKRSQATGNVKQVTMADQMMKESRDMLIDWKKLSGI